MQSIRRPLFLMSALLYSRADAFHVSSQRRARSQLSMVMQQPPTSPTSRTSVIMDSSVINGELPTVRSNMIPTVIGTGAVTPSNAEQRIRLLNSEDLRPVLAAALLITSNTIGAGTLVLPEVAAKPGMGATVGMFAVVYAANLISGLLLADVAIKQRDSSGDDVPSSFKDFAEVNLESEAVATGISAVSLFTNFCILAFGLTRAGSVMANIVGMDPYAMSLGFAAALGALIKTQTSKKLSEFSSLLVTPLFVSFAGLLLPGLASVQDPLATLLAPGTDADLSASVSTAFPIIMTTLVFGNIVPSVTKILDYDRAKTTAAIVLGSFIPLLLYLAWCFACLGGGVNLGEASPLITMFSIAAASGSCLGCVMSISEELDSFWKPNSDAESNFSLPSVLTAISVPLAASFLLTNGYGDFSIPLKLAGSYGCPLLYGAIPAAMAWTQRDRLLATNTDNSKVQITDIVPGGYATLGLLGAGATSLIGQELSLDLSGFL